MSAIKFNHVFAALMLLSALAAFVIPEKYTARVQPQVQGLFVPVATPARAAAAWVHRRVAKPEPKDARDLRAIAEENDALRRQNVALRHALEELRRVNADRASLKELRELCTPVRVVGPDLGGRQSLSLAGSPAGRLEEGMFALHSRGVAGLITRPAGRMGAQVRLITDPGVRVTAYFRKLEKDENGQPHARRLSTPAAVVEGTGDGAMRCLGLTMEQVNAVKLAPGDWVVLEDKDWDERLHGQRLGTVADVRPQTAAPLFAEIRVQPTTNLTMLREVMVLTK